MFLVLLIAYLPKSKKSAPKMKHIGQIHIHTLRLEDYEDSTKLAVTSLFNFMKCFPSLARKYYQECDKHLLDIVLPYIKDVISPAILDHEIKKIETA